MARTTTSRAMLSLLASTSLLLASTMADSKCYDTWGNEDPNQQPCSSGSGASWCCTKSDVCLSNGLCLSPGYNNLMTQQGCTDKDWAGCKQFCSAADRKYGTPSSIPLIPCAKSFNNLTNDIKFCCGTYASSCCDTPSSWTAIPSGALLSASSSSSSSSTTLRLALGIGLGLGLPILLVLLAVAYLLAQPLHRRRRRRKHNPAATATTTTTTSDDDEKAIGRSRRKHRRDRRNSFGRVDTNVGPPSDDGTLDPWGIRDIHAWPPTTPASAGGGGGGGGAGGMGMPMDAAAMVAAWRAGATYPIGGIGNVDQGPPSPKEIDGRARSRAGGAGRAGTPAELPTDDSGIGAGVSEMEGSEGRSQKRVQGTVKVDVKSLAEEVELPTPDSLGGRDRRAR